ncbi:MAG: aldo/keto reductase [Alphaproteobacteria bacterium]|nr:aldo/keto reductase [Alphaproteobacteria bacterium]
MGIANRRALGNTGWTVGAIGLGGMPMSIQGRPSEDQSLTTIDAALEAGVDLVDTADVYCLDDGDLGHNERLIREGLRQWGGDRRVIVATKGGCTRPGGRWDTDGRPSHLRAACERSLKALGVERIDLYQLHAPDRRVPFEDSVGELARLKEQGKIAHVGLSNVDVAQIRAACAIVPIETVQNRLSPQEVRNLRDGVVAECEARGITFLAYSPVGGRRGVAAIRSDPALTAIGARHRASGPEIALAWLLAKSPAILPIPGASKAAHARSSARAADLALSDEDVATLDRAFLGTR